jgi:DNA modification methylase
MKSNILTGDSFELIKDIPDNSIDLIITSPPYADIVNYGKNISIQKPQDYCDWLLPIFNEIQRVLKPSGSFILNINDTCKNGSRNPFIYELIYRSQKETKLKFYDTYIWHKRNGIPNGGTKRFRNTTEFIFHFIKDQKHLKFYMDRALIDASETYKQRSKTPQGVDRIVIDGKRIKKSKKIKYLTGSTNKTKEGYELPQTERELPDKVRPDNVVRFSTAASARDNTIKHPAPYHKDLPLYYINLLTDEGDVVLDVFSGIGTTGMACKELNRDYIGMELNEKYAEFSEKRINGEELKLGYLINQYDMEDNFIQSFNNPSEACKAVDCNSFHHILTCYRGHSQSYMGYKWMLEKR